MEEKIKNDAEGILKNILYFMNVAAPVDSSVSERVILLSVDTKDGGILIGNRGETLSALQHLVSILIKKKYGSEYKVSVDVGGYKQDQDRRVMEFAKSLAERVKQSGGAETLRPMTSYERRLVHTVISEYPELSSESTGEDPNRRIVIRKNG